MMDSLLIGTGEINKAIVLAAMQSPSTIVEVSQKDRSGANSRQLIIVTPLSKCLSTYYLSVSTIGKGVEQLATDSVNQMALFE